MDISMPVMNGVECLMELSRHPKLQKIPVVVLSSSTSQSDIARKLGAKAYLQKSSDLNSLRGKVKGVLNHNFGKREDVRQVRNVLHYNGAMTHA